MSFDLLVVGSGGGPSEANLSAYLLKAHERDWADGVVAIEAGSGIGALDNILKSSPDLLSKRSKGKATAAREVYSYVKTFLVTHAHLDHIMSLVLLAGSMKGPRKSIRGSRQCLEDIDTIFAPNRLWPTLASWNVHDSEHLYLFDPLPDRSDIYTPLHDVFSVRCLPISHGTSYLSSAFFIRHNIHNKEFLFFGDVEPDVLAEKPLTATVWDVAAPKIVSGTLDTLFIECSWTDDRTDDQLYGHLTPSHLVTELEVLAKKVQAHRKNAIPTKTPNVPRTASMSENGQIQRKRSASTSLSKMQPKRLRSRKAREDGSETIRGSLSGLRVYIIHCKEDMDGAYPGRKMHDVIAGQVRALVEERVLGSTIIAAKQGMLIEI